MANKKRRQAGLPRISAESECVDIKLSATGVLIFECRPPTLLLRLARLFPESPSGSVKIALSHSLRPQFSRYLDAIQPTVAQRQLATDELSFLEDKLRDYIRDDDPYRFVKALRSGSFAKATALRRTVAADFDADLAVYVDEDDPAAADFSSLIDYVETIAERAYENRTKRPARFEKNESCVRAVFDVSPKINIDIVPIIQIAHDTIPNWGVLPKRNGTTCFTSVSEHIAFVRSRNDDSASVPFRKIIRLVKVWRKHVFDTDDHPAVGSFLLELIFGNAFDTQRFRLTGDALPDLSLLTAAVLRHGLERPIVFPDQRVPSETRPHKDPVVVLDPINRDDNVASDWTDTDRDHFLERLEVLRDVLRDAEIEAPHDVDAAIHFLDQVLPNFATSSSA